MTAALMRNSSE